MRKYFGRHYGTERFFVLIAAFVVLLGFLTGTSIYAAHMDGIRTLTGTAVYTTSYTWSRTSDKGKVVGISSNSDNTKVFIMLYNESGASRNASEYTAYMTGADAPMVNHPVCTMYSYGNGYFGICLTDARGFNNQIYSIILRNDTAASILADSNTFDPNIERDQSFYDHNQIRLYVNLGAVGIEKLHTLDEEVISPMDIYADMIKSKEYQEIVNKLIVNTETMQSQYAKVLNYRNDLANWVIVPDMPYYVRDDHINTLAFDKEEPNIFTVSMCGEISGSIGSKYNEFEISSEDVSGNVLSGIDYTDAKKYIDRDGIEHNYYYLHTEYLFPGCVNFDWQGRDLSYGFINQIYADGAKIADSEMLFYYERYRSFKEVYGSSNYKEMMPERIYGTYDIWRDLSGNSINPNSSGGGGNSYDSTVNSTITAYQTAINGYMSEKSKYYANLDAILALEYNVRSMSRMLTTNSDTESFYLY